MSAPRHRREMPLEQPLVRYEPLIPLRSSDFDAVSPMRLPQQARAENPSREKSDALARR